MARIGIKEEINKLTGPGKQWLRAHRTNLYQLQKGLCFYCHKKVKFDKCTADHVIPLSKGGTNTPDNIVMSCKCCNARKGNTIYSRPRLAALRTALQIKLLWKG